MTRDAGDPESWSSPKRADVGGSCCCFGRMPHGVWGMWNMRRSTLNQTAPYLEEPLSWLHPILTAERHSEVETVQCQAHHFHLVKTQMLTAFLPCLPIFRGQKMGHARSLTRTVPGHQEAVPYFTILPRTLTSRLQWRWCYKDSLPLVLPMFLGGLKASYLRAPPAVRSLGPEVAGCQGL